MEFLIILCLSLGIVTYVAAAPGELQTYKIKIRLVSLHNIPVCKHENRRLDGNNRCDFKLKLREINSVEGKEGSIRVQTTLDMVHWVDTAVIAVRRMNISEKFNMTIDIFDYDQANYHPDRLLGHFTTDLNHSVNHIINLNTDCEMKSKFGYCIEVFAAANLEDKVLSGSQWSSQLKMEINVTTSIIEPGIILDPDIYRRSLIGVDIKILILWICLLILTLWTLGHAI